MSNPICCGQESKEVRMSVNVTYFFCDSCRKEVEAKKELDFNIMPDDFPDHWGSYSQIYEDIAYLTIVNPEAADIARLINESNAELFAQQPVYIPQEEVDAAVRDLTFTLSIFEVVPMARFSLLNHYAADSMLTYWDDNYDEYGLSTDYAHLRDF